MPVDMNELYARNPGTVKTEQAAPAVASTATTRDAAATSPTSKGTTASTGVLSDAAMADSQINRITSQDSPYIQQARNQGMLAAGKRGLQNSSIAAGAAEAEAVKAAAPLALQNAQLTASNEMTDKAATNRAGEFTAGAENTANLTGAQLQTQTSLSNAAEANRASGQNAALQTQTSQFNTGSQQNVNNLNAAADNEMRRTVMNANVEFNRQYLQGSQSLDLAELNNRYQQLISTNQNAASLYNAYFQSISTMMANEQISPARAATAIAAQQTMLQSGLELIGGIDRMSFGPPGAVSTSGPGGTPIPARVAPPDRISDTVNRVVDSAIPLGPKRDVVDTLTLEPPTTN